MEAIQAELAALENLNNHPKPGMESNGVDEAEYEEGHRAWLQPVPMSNLSINCWNKSFFGGGLST